MNSFKSHSLNADTLSGREINAKPAGRFAFVVPRYGAQIGGGAETLVREIAERLAARGDEVTVLSTCAVDNRTWENAIPAGVSSEEGVQVERFAVDARDLEQWIPYQIRLSEGLRLSIEEQFRWLENGVNSVGLYERVASLAPEVDFIFFAPYLFSTTFFGSLIAEQVAPGKAVLIPCLHDEAYAYVESIGSMFRSVGRCLFNAEPEQALAERLYGPIDGSEVGMGFEPPAEEYVQRLEPYFDSAAPYLVYVGRKETGKNADFLVDCFISFKDKLASVAISGENADSCRDLKLVLVGGGSFGDLHRPEALARADIIDLQHVSERDKHRLMRHAAFLCQPSTNESFSIVLMESWLLGTPVLVHAQCPVTRTHCIESSGGLYFSDLPEFAAVCERLVGDEQLRQTLAHKGSAYVRQKYSWAAVLDRFDTTLANIKKESSGLQLSGAERQDAQLCVETSRAGKGGHVLAS